MTLELGENMNIKLITPLIFIALLFASVILSSSAGQVPDEQGRRKYVRGLKEIALVMTGEDETPEGRKLKTEIELKLRNCGLRVGTYKKSAPIFVATCTAIKNPSEGYTRRLLVYLSEYTPLRRDDNNTMAFVTTWESSLNGDAYIDSGDWDTLKSDIMSAVDEFINDWQSTNR